MKRAGTYLVNVQPGTYVVTVSKQGFTVFKINAQKVDVGFVHDDQRDA